MSKNKEDNKTQYERTISEELFKAWQKFRRRCDGDKIAMAIGYSRPVIDRALNFGYVKTDGLTEKISKFFADRLEAENTAAHNLNQLLEK